MKSSTEMSKQIDLEKLKARMLKALSGEGFNEAATCGEVLELLDHIAALEKENASLKQDAARLNELLAEAKSRLADVLENDDGQAWKEGRKFLEKIDTAMEASNAKAD